MIEILKSIELEIKNPSSVIINLGKVSELALTVSQQDLESSQSTFFTYNWDLENQIRINFLFNTLNFCYWAKKGENKWKVDFPEASLDGAVALFRCLEEEVLKNPDFLKGSFLSNLNETDLQRILKGNVVIPLFKERLACLNEAGKVLEEKYEGDFLNVFNRSNNDAVELVNLLTTDFPSFRDESDYKGRTVAFYKRAQLNSRMINGSLLANGNPPLINLDKLTAFADYKVPQILRTFGILEYSEELANKIDNKELIEANSKDEVEIRSASIWAVELIRQKLSERFKNVTAAEIDCLLWDLSQIRVEGEKPYHRTLTIAY